MSNAQKRREHRHRNKAYPGLMTQDRVAEHKMISMRLADLERLRKIVVANTTDDEVGGE